MDSTAEAQRLQCDQRQGIARGPSLTAPTRKLVYLAKDNSMSSQACLCDPAYLAFPTQTESPWDGTGWLFTCMACRKRFPLARAVEVDLSWRDLGQLDLAGEPRLASDENVDIWVTAMQAILRTLQVGRQ